MNKQAGILTFSMILIVASSAKAELIGHWELDQTEGTVVKDSSSYGHDGVLQGGLSFGKDSCPGQIGNAVHIQAEKGQNIRIDSLVLPAGAFTISLWFCPDSDMDSHSRRAYLMFWCGPESPEGDKPYIEFNEEDEGRFRFYVSIVGQPQYALQTKTQSWKAGTWYHLATTFDGNEFRLYINGILEDSVRRPGRHYRSVGVCFGSRADGQHCFKGKLDDIRIYDQAFSPERIAELMQPDPTLKALRKACRQAEALVSQDPRKAISFVNEKINQALQWRQHNPGRYKTLLQELLFDLHFFLARAKEIAGLPKNEVEAAYNDALLEGAPSLERCPLVLQSLLETGRVETFDALVDALNTQNKNYLHGVAARAETMLAEGKSTQAVKFLETNLTSYERWQSAHPVTDVVSEQRLPEVYFQLAKAREAAGADKKAIAQAYRDTFRHSRLDYIPQRTTAFAWLLERNFLEQCRSIISSNENEDEIAEPLATIVLNLCRHYQTEKDWVVFERLLDVLFSQSKCPHRWAMLVESAFDDRHSRWAKKYFEYVRTRPRLVFERDRAYAERKVAEGRYDDAARLYEALLSRCGKEDKAQVEFELYRTMFLAGQYQAVIPKLEDYIIAYKATNRAQVKEAMLLKARAHIKLSQFTEARDICFILLMEYPELKEMAEATFFVGYANMLEGDFEQALNAFEIVVRDWPESKYAAKAKVYLERIRQILQ